MKYKIYNSIIVIVSILLIIFLAGDNLSYAQGITVIIDGEPITYNNDFPFIDSNGRTQVPFRQTMETFGAVVSWNSETSTAIASLNSVIVEVPIGKPYVFRDKVKISNDTSAVIVEGRTYLPIRVVIEAFGGTVNWNSTLKAVDIESFKNADILAYKIPLELGKPKLTIPEIEAIVGAEPKEIQEKISTVNDLLQYMKSSGYNNVSGDVQINENGYTWHFNRPAESTLILNEGNCGATANLVNYVLKDDYDEVGFINFSADSRQGGHVFNYIKENGQYYIIDFLQYPISGYTRYNYRILSINKLEDYPDYCLSSYGNSKDHQIKIIVSYTSESYLPIANLMQGTECVMRFLPKDNEIKVLFETPLEGKAVEFISKPSREPAW